VGDYNSKFCADKFTLEIMSGLRWTVESLLRSNASDFQKEKTMNPKYMKSMARFISAAMLFALLTGLVPGTAVPVRAAPGDITRISVDSSGAQANDGSSRSQISADGRYVAFVSGATNLVANDTNNAPDVFVKDRQTGATTRVSVVSQTGAQANGGSDTVAISSDGRYVAFYSSASNLVSGDTNGIGDIFVYDRQTSETKRASVASNGVEANGESSDYYLAISGDGRFVAFPSEASNLVSGDANGVNDIFVHDFQTGQTRRVSVASDGTESNGSAYGMDISADGRYVAFSSSATNLVTGDTNGTRDIFVYDLQTGSTTRVSVNSRGEQADGGSSEPSISGDGRYVAFLSASGNLDPRADYYTSKEIVYVHDRQIGQTTLASVYSEGTIMEVGLANQPVISDNGRYVTFPFYEKGDNNGILHVWARDLQTGASTRLEGGNGSGHASISADGRFVAFSSDTPNLVSDDTNGISDIFVREVDYGPEHNPAVASITPDCGFSTPLCTYPTPDTISFIVLFSEPVTGVGADDFSLDMLDGVTGASITGVSGSGVQYFVTVNSGAHDGQLRLKLVDNDSIVDTVLNPLGGAGAGNGDSTGKSYRIDKSNPTVTSIVRADSDPTASETVRFSVNFSEIVYPVRASDFVLSTTGDLSGATVTDVSPTGESAAFTVTVNSGTGNGSLRLDLIDGDSILDYKNNPLGGVGAGNGNFATGETYTINKVTQAPPSVLSVTRADADSTNAEVVRFTVTFSEAVSGVDASDFTIIASGIKDTIINDISGSGATYIISVVTGSGSGTLRLDLTDDDSILNAASQPLGGVGVHNSDFTTGEEYAISKPPTQDTSDLARVSVDSNGVEGNGRSSNGKVSDNGQYVAFESAATNLVAGDTNNAADIFFKDRQTGATTRVSVSTTGEQANGNSGGVAISGDGRYVAFYSDASNLVSGDTNGKRDIFVRDRNTGTTTLVSINSAGVQANDTSSNISISEDGRFIVFLSKATNLVNNDTNSVQDVFVHDCQTGATTLVSVDSAGTQANASSYSPSISTNGRYLVFSSSATNLVNNDANETSDVFVHDLQTGQTVIASVNSNGVQADRGASNPSISGDGRYVTFSSSAYNLVDMETYDLEYLYVHDLQSGATTGVTIGENNAMYGWAEESIISANGRYIAFSYNDKGDGDDVVWIYVYDRISQNKVEIAQGGGNSIPSLSSLSADGLYLSYYSAGPEASDDTNGVEDVFVKQIEYPQELNPTVTSVGQSCPYGCTNHADQVIYFNVIFSEGVTGVDMSDFLLSVTGNITGATITGVSGSGESYIISVDTGTGDGTLRLDVIDDDSIKDFPQNPLGGAGIGNGSFTGGEVYVVDKSIPTVTSIVRADQNPTASGSVNFLVTFSEDVNWVDVSDFALSITGGISGATVTNVTGSGGTYSVQVNTGTGDGTLRLDLIDDETICDGVYNPLGGEGAGNGSFTSGESYTIDRDPPVVTSIQRADPNPTTANTVRFKVTFSKPVANVDTNDFTLSKTGSISTASIGKIDSLSNIYTVTVTIGNGSGTLRLDLIDNDTITDLTGKQLGGSGIGNGSFTKGEVYTITLAPTIIDVSYRSTGSADGWVLESSENSNVGKTKNIGDSTLRLGDDAQNRQYRSILHFPTYYLPDNAIITQAILMIKKQSVTGTNPFTTHQNISIDIHSGLFGGFSLFKSGSLQPNDFEAKADMYMVGTIQNNPVNDWYWASLDSRAFPYINLKDGTQLRLSFQLDDNNDKGNDYINFYSGDAVEQTDRPHLLIEYYVPR
jgi:hypothetical protein